MPWVTFAKPYIFTPPEDRRCSVKYPAGWRGNVRRICAELARGAGAVEIEDDASGSTAGTADLPAEVD